LSPLAVEAAEPKAKDFVEAYKWCFKAAGNGNRKAKEFIPTLEQDLSGDQISEGQNRAKALKDLQEGRPRMSEDALPFRRAN